MAWLSNGIARRKAAQVLGASCSSKRAWNVRSPAWTMSWLIQDTRDALTEGFDKKIGLQRKLPEARNIPAGRQNSKAFDACGERIKRVWRFGKSRAYSSDLFLS